MRKFHRELHHDHPNREMLDRLQHLFRDLGMSLWRGHTEPSKSRFAHDPGDFGRGVYWTSSCARAKCYGKSLKRAVIKLQSALVLSVSDAYALAAKYGTVGPQFSMDQKLANASRMTEELKAQGYDGLVSVRRAEWAIRN